MFCQNCGKEIDNNSKFCPHCGNQVGAYKRNENDSLVNTIDKMGGIFIAIGLVSSFITFLVMSMIESGDLDVDLWDYYYGDGEEIATTILIISVVTFVIGIVMLICASSAKNGKK